MTEVSCWVLSVGRLGDSGQITMADQMRINAISQGNGYSYHSEWETKICGLIGKM